MGHEQKIRVAIVDDHEIMRGGLRFIFLSYDDLELVGEACSGEEAIKLCAIQQPDVVLMDLKMPKMDGIDATRRLKSEHPSIQVLMLTSFHDHDLVQKSLSVGAIGYILKDASGAELAAAIRSAAKGHSTLCPDAAKDLVSSLPPKQRPLDELTDRELSILKLLAQGMTNPQIASQLHRSPFTVRHHVSQILTKLGVANRAEAVAVGIENGLLS